MSGVMQGFPPAPAGRATLANWRDAPYSAWAFHHVREIVPTADIPNDPAAVRPLESAPRDFSGLSFAGPDGAEWSFEGFLEASATDAVVVLASGRIVFERYANGMGPDSPHILMSVSKSMLGLLVGVLAGRGVLDPDRPVEAILPEVADTAYRGATLRHLLDMRAGIAFDEDYVAFPPQLVAYRKATNWNPLAPGDEATDLRGFYGELTERDGPHGRGFHYVSPNTDLLGWAMERASGARYADLFADLVWKPLGAERPGYITVDRLGAPRAAGGMCLTARDLARVGQLLVEGGARGSAQIVPEAWIADIATNGDPEGWAAGDFAPFYPGADIHYRSKWYVERPGADGGPMFFGLGVHGQNLFVDPARELVVAKFSSQAHPLDPELIPLARCWAAALRRAVAA